MRHRGFSFTMAMAAVVAVLLLAPISAAGQARTTTTKAWSPSRTPDGQPNMQGTWVGETGGAASHSIEEGCCEPEHIKIQGRTDNIGLEGKIIVDPADGRIPYQPWAVAKRTEHLINTHTPTKLRHIDPEDICYPLGVPRSNYRGQFQITQLAGHVVILYEWNHAFRVIPLDGRPHVGNNIKMYNGDSRGRWEGNTLVVDVTNFNDEPWFDSHGSFYSDALHVVERWTLVGPDTIRYEATIEDPKVFTRPWKMAFPIERDRNKTYELMEIACIEGVSVEHRLAAGRLAVAAGQTGIHTHTEAKEEK